jgi:hypothetical protein
LEILKSEQPVLILDNDMFPIADFSFYKKLESHSVRGVVNTSQDPRSDKRVDWIWSGLLYIDPPRMQSKEIWSFDCGKIEGIPVDVSGQTHHWLEKYRNTENGVSVLNHLSSNHWLLSESPIRFSEGIEKFLISDDRNENNKIFCELYDSSFLHFRAGSNWRLERPEIVIKRNSDFLDLLVEHANK